VFREDLRLYTATTFPNDPNAGCEIYLRRMRAFGYLAGEPDGDLGDFWIDALDATGDIVESWPITKAGFDWLRERLKFVQERVRG